MKKPITIHKIHRGRIALGLLTLALAYVTMSLAIDSGRLTQYFLTIALVVIGVRWLATSFRRA